MVHRMVPQVRVPLLDANLGLVKSMLVKVPRLPNANPRSLLLCISLLLLASPAFAQEIWFGPPQTAVDFMDLFSPDAPWQEAASHVRVLLLTGKYLSGAPQDDVDRIVEDMNRRHIAIGLSVGVMESGPPSSHPSCGGQGLVEGYGRLQLAELHSKKIKHAGGTISYIAMDEPLWFGHYFKGKPGGQPGCHSSVREILSLIRGPLAVYAREFPNIIVGDTEPANMAQRPDWKENLRAFAAGFRRQYGYPLAFMQLDTPFNYPGIEALTANYYRESQQLKREGLIEKIGIIYDGTPDDPTDEAWVSDAKDHIRLLEGSDHMHPDQALIFSWMAHPRRMLPESSPGSMTGLVEDYARHHRK